MAKERYIVVGGGLAGAAAVMKLAEAGADVDLISMVPARRSHSVCAQGGINGAVNTKGEGDSPWVHFVDTIKGGAYLNHQPPVKGMCDDAPAVINLMDRMGVMFNRTSEGLLDFRRFGGTLHHRTAYAGATTGQQLLYGLDEQVRRYQAEGKVRRFEHHEFLGVALDDQGRCRGAVVQDLWNMEMVSVPAAAVILATGGPGLIFGRTTNSVINTGLAAGAAYKQGAWYANGEFIQVHPTAIPGEDKHRLMSESARGEGGRVWVPRQAGDKRDPMDIPEKERLYFLEEKYPQYGNLVPRDIATREIFQIYKEGLGIGGQPMVYLDLTHKDPDWLTVKLGGIMEIYEKFKGADPRHTPMQIFPAVHYSMGGLWVDFVKDAKTGGIVAGHPRNQSTNIPGLYAAGEVDYQYHGANRLGANSLMSCIWTGMRTAEAVLSYAKSTDGVGETPASLLDAALKLHQADWERLKGLKGKENPFQLHLELGEQMNAKCTIIRDNDELDGLYEKIGELEERLKNADPCETGQTLNMSLPFIRQLEYMMLLAKVIVKGARMRDESRGSHEKPAFTNETPSKDEALDSPVWDQFHSRFEKQDSEWLKTTIARNTASGPEITYEPLDLSLLAPMPRDYTGQGKPAWKLWVKERRKAYYAKTGEKPPIPFGQRATGKFDENGVELCEIDPDWAAKA